MNFTVNFLFSSVSLSLITLIPVNSLSLVLNVIRSPGTQKTTQILSPRRLAIFIIAQHGQQCTKKPEN